MNPIQRSSNLPLPLSIDGGYFVGTHIGSDWKTNNGISNPATQIDALARLIWAVWLTV
jgi:hypothetical protein